LVLLYHPDKNIEKSLSNHYFLEIQEAYAVLSDPSSRKSYDSKWRKEGAFSSKTKELSAEFVLGELKKIKHSFLYERNINKDIVAGYFEYLLSPSFVEILIIEGHSKLNKEIINHCIFILERLPFEEFFNNKEALEKIATPDQDLLESLVILEKNRKQEKLVNQLLPWFVILSTLLLCLGMYFFAKM